MSENKNTVEKFINGFNTADHTKILSCLTDDVEWEMPGSFHHFGKEAFDKELENAAFTGNPVVSLSRMIEENNVVAAEGIVKTKTKNGEMINGFFCDVFELKNGKIKKLTSYLMEVNR